MVHFGGKLRNTKYFIIGFFKIYAGILKKFNIGVIYTESIYSLYLNGMDGYIPKHKQGMYRHWFFIRGKYNCWVAALSDLGKINLKYCFKGWKCRLCYETLPKKYTINQLKLPNIF